MWLTKEPRRAATPHRAEVRTCSRRVHRQHELLPSHGRDWDEKGRFCPRKHLDGNTIRTSAVYLTTCLHSAFWRASLIPVPPARVQRTAACNVYARERCIRMLSCSVKRLLPSPRWPRSVPLRQPRQMPVGASAAASMAAVLAAASAVAASMVEDSAAADFTAALAVAVSASGLASGC